MNVLFLEHPSKPLKGGYCSYYSEIYHALSSVFDITFGISVPRKISDLGSDWDVVIMGFGHTDCGDRRPPTVIQDTNIPVFPILNKEYTGLSNKLDWIKCMKPTACLTVHHDTEKFSEVTGVPFHRIMWSANENQFKDYGGSYESDLFFSGVTRPEQTENLRERVLSQMKILDGYKLHLNIRSHKNNYSGKIYNDDEYSRHLSSSKICFITTGPADLVGTRYFEVMAGNRSLILCNKMNEKVYENMLIDGYNCVMFSTVSEFYEKAIYYLTHEDERMKIVNQAYQHFKDTQTWSHRANQIKKIIEGYVK